MHTQRWMAVLSVSLVVLYAALPGAAEEQAARESTPTTGAPPAGVCATLPALPFIDPSPVPVQGCGFCSGNDFCPESGVRCTWDGTCDRGSNHCCNYTCECDASCTSVSQPAEACSFQVPDCTGCPPRTLCQTSYCGAEGILCTFNGTCGPGGCCNYDCGPNSSCTLPDPLPPNAC